MYNAEMKNISKSEFKTFPQVNSKHEHQSDNQKAVANLRLPYTHMYENNLTRNHIENSKIEYWLWARMRGFTAATLHRQDDWIK